MDPQEAIYDNPIARLLVGGESMERRRAHDEVGTVSYLEGSIRFHEAENQMAHKCKVEEGTQKFSFLGCLYFLCGSFSFLFSSLLGHLYCGLLLLSL